MDRYSLKRIAADRPPDPKERLFSPEVDGVAARAIEDVRTGGEKALRAWAVKLGELKPGDRLLYDRTALEEALDGIDPGVRALLERAKSRVAAFAAAQRACLADLDTAVPGGRAGHVFVPVSRAGCYVPGGRYPLPSSAIMTVTPAAVAGVGEVWCAGPRPTQVTLAAACIAGARGFLACGGAHAIAAMAFGSGLPRCDTIVGPGGRYVASAKRQLFGAVGTEAPAGPSELLVIADDDADPDIVAADLIGQAEHDTAATPMLICFSEHFAKNVELSLGIRLDELPEPNQAAARAALANGWICVAGSREQACSLAEACAPEHLELIIADAEALARSIHSAGAVFIGQGSAEVFGDYGAGPNHCLPTGGAARFSAGLSVLQFLRMRSWLCMEEPQSLVDDTAAFAALEGLEGHARSALARARPDRA